jgi:hypothetical protein
MARARRAEWHCMFTATGFTLSGFMKRIDGDVQRLNVADCASLDATAKALTA